MQQADIRALAKRVLERNRSCNDSATARLNEGVKSNQAVLHYEQTFQVFEYRVSQSGPWHNLFSIVQGDTTEKVKHALKAQLGRPVEVRVRR